MRTRVWDGEIVVAHFFPADGSHVFSLAEMHVLPQAQQCRFVCQLELNCYIDNACQDQGAALVGINRDLTFVLGPQKVTIRPAIVSPNPLQTLTAAGKPGRFCHFANLDIVAEGGAKFAIIQQAVFDRAKMKVISVIDRAGRTCIRPADASVSERPTP